MYEINAYADDDGELLASRRVPESEVNSTLDRMGQLSLPRSFHLIAVPYTPVWSNA